MKQFHTEEEWGHPAEDERIPECVSAIPVAEMCPVERERFDLFSECLRFGATLDRSMIDSLRWRYERYSEKNDSGERTILLNEISRAVEDGVGSVISILPFINYDRDPDVIQTATLEVAMQMPLVDGNPMTGPVYLLETARDATDEITRAGVVGGLILLGDKRALPLVRDSWRTLRPAVRPFIMNAWSGYALAGQIEFLLQWLEDAPEYDFGGIVSALSAIPQRAEYPYVVDIERVFPVDAGGEGEAVRTIGRWSFEEFGRLLAPRLHDIARRESSPKVMPYVMRAWGID